MKVTFNIGYHTAATEKLFISGVIDGADAGPFAGEMQCPADGRWTLSLDFPPSAKEIRYRYALVNANGDMTFEPWERAHHLAFDSLRTDCELYDCWQTIPSGSVFYTSAFTKNRFAHERRKPAAATFDRTLILRVMNPCVAGNQQLAVAGNQACTGFWNPSQAAEMHCIGAPEWEIRLNMDEISFPLEYKFLVRDATGQPVRWETGENRVFTYPPTEGKTTVVIAAYPFRDDRPMWKGAGTAIPVFSLRSRQSFGIGDLHDLKLLIDWAAQTGQCLIQVLPVNDTTRTHTRADSYPYSAISICALHPSCISLAEMGALKDAGQAAFFRRIQQELNAKESVDYENVMKFKLQYCRAFFGQEGAAILRSAAFRTFLDANRQWLVPYASFCFFRDKYRTPDFSRWGENASYSPSAARKLCREDSEAYPEISFTFFLQFVLHTQFRAASDYARSKGVILKGDLPIGIHRTSVEAWTEPALFNPGGQAGAPPDDFSETGQNWSFPTYNWEVMEKDGYEWWKNRFRKMEDYFDCFRIDHILGFFRIWEIPLEYVQGLCGHFRPALPLTVEEIEAYGLKFNAQWTRPRIHRRHLAELFGAAAEAVTEAYLSPADGEYVTLNALCDTQRKTEQLFRECDGASARIRDGLFAIACERLFLEDPYEKSRYHPRISAARSYAFRELAGAEQQAVDALSRHFFHERHNAFWKTEALKRLTPLIASTNMLVCGEDLGMIPAPVREVMDKLQILSLELERAPKIYGEAFTDLQRLPYLSVCTTSTHDMNPLRNWWKEDAERTQAYFRSVLHEEGAAPEECSAGLAARILGRHLNAPSMLTVIPLQDWLSMSDALKRHDAAQERINIPADPHHYWCYRMHLSLEELLQAHDFNREIRAMLSVSGR
jgi:4-alpha-glucanotransferase